MNKRASELKAGDKVTGLGVFSAIGNIGAAKSYKIKNARSAEHHNVEYMHISFEGSDSEWMVPPRAYIELEKEQAQYYYANSTMKAQEYPPKERDDELNALVIITESGKVVKNRYGPTGQIS